MSSKICEGCKSYEIRLENLNEPWREVLHLGVRCLFPKHHMEPGEKMRGFYFIRRGVVRLSYIGDAGQERSSLFMKRNCLFNEIPALNQDAQNAAFFCMEESEVWRFDADLLRDPLFIAKYPKLISNLMESMAKKSTIFFSHLSSMAFSSSMSQMCAMLLQLAQSGGPRITQGQMAAMLGLHPTTVARLVRTLRNEGILGKFTKTELEVLDMERLRATAEKNA